MEFSFQLKGMDKLQRQLRRMSPRDSSRMAKIATRKAGKILLEEMRGRVPVRRGNLKRSLGLVNVRRTAPGAWLKVGARSGKRLKNDGWYAHLVEFPTRAHKLGRGSNSSKDKQSGAEHPGTRAQPFMRPSVDAVGQEVIDAIAKELGNAIEEFY